jgi:membrane protease subunit HflK
MAWNEPGGGDKDPWSGRGSEQGPPDLDEIVRKMQDRFGGLFGGRKKGGGGAGRPEGGGKLGVGLIILIAAIVWLLSGIYIIDEGKRGVVLRFGKFTEITMPGPHWHIPYPVEEVEVVDVGQRRFVEVGYRSTGGRGNTPVAVPKEALMLTQDENIVNIQLAVQYQVKDPRAYLFNVRDPDLTLKQATESAIREVVGKSKMDFVLKEGRGEISQETKDLLQQIMDQYRTGLLVTTVNLQDAQPPEEVQGAFADAIKAREDEARQKNEAEAYSNDILPKARGAAARQLEEANAYRASIIAKAEGEASRFRQLMEEYQKAPEVTRKRLYIDAMEKVFSDTSKVTVDLKQGNSLLYLPLDKMIEGSAGAAVKTLRDLATGGSEATQSGMDRTPARPTRTPRESR